MAKSKWLSLVVGALYFVGLGVLHLQGSLRTSDGVTAVFVVLLIWVSMCVALIWFADEIAPCLGPGRWRDFLEADWGIFLRIVGWLMLLLPAILILLKKLRIARS